MKCVIGVALGLDLLASTTARGRNVLEINQTPKILNKNEESNLQAKKNKTSSSGGQFQC